MVRVGAQALMKFWSGRLAIRPKCGLASINFAPVRYKIVKEIIVKIIWIWIIELKKKTNLADCDRDVGSFLTDGEIRTWKKKNMIGFPAVLWIRIRDLVNFDTWIRDPG